MPAVLNLRLFAGKGRAGRKIGEVEEGYIEQLEVGDTFIFGGQVWRLMGMQGVDVLISPAPGTEPKMPSWGGSKFALSTYLARRVRRMIAEEPRWRDLPPDVREWLHAQKRRSLIPAMDEMLVETFPRHRRHFLVAYPFEGRLAHTTLAMLLTKRLERAGAGPIGFVAGDYALAVWSARPMHGLDFDDLFQEDMLGDDLEAWLEESFMMKRSFRNCALIAGLIERRFPGMEKSGRQVTFSSDLIFDVLRRHQPDHLLLRCAREDAATGLLDVGRLGDLLTRIKGRIRPMALDRVSPFAVPALLSLGQERVPGVAQDWVLEEAEDDLIAEAMA